MLVWMVTAMDSSLPSRFLRLLILSQMSAWGSGVRSNLLPKSSISMLPTCSRRLSISMSGAPKSSPIVKASDSLMPSKRSGWTGTPRRRTAATTAYRLCRVDVIVCCWAVCTVVRVALRSTLYRGRYWAICLSLKLSVFAGIDLVNWSRGSGVRWMDIISVIKVTVSESKVHNFASFSSFFVFVCNKWKIMNWSMT